MKIADQFSQQIKAKSMRMVTPDEAEALLDCEEGTFTELEKKLLFSFLKAIAMLVKGPSPQDMIQSIMESVTQGNDRDTKKDKQSTNTVH